MYGGLMTIRVKLVVEWMFSRDFKVDMFINK